jgi:site-specific DNA recombinase
MEEPRKRACALVRVSTEEQARGGTGLKFQEEDIRNFCDRNNLELLRVFRDEGYSGATSNRPGFKEMMEWAREKRFEVIVVWKLDRLFRDTKLTLQTVDELASLNIEFRSVQESFTHDSNGRFLLTIFAAGAEKERKDINLRMYSGRTAAAKRGTIVNGASNPAYGYRYDKTSKKLFIAKEEAAVVRKMFHWFVDEKLSLYKIQCRLNDMRVPTKYDRQGWKKRTGTTGWWHKRTIGRLLENEIYTGYLIMRKYKKWGAPRNESNLRPRNEWIPIETPKIISEKVYELAQEQLRKNAAEAPRNTKRLYLLGKLLVCGHDGKKMVAARLPGDGDGASRNYYFCGAVNKSNFAVKCPAPRVREYRVVPPVWDKLKELLTNPSAVLRQLAEYQKEKTMVSDAGARLKALEKNQKRTEEGLRRLAEVYVSGAVDKAFYDREHRRLRDQADEVRRELRKVEAVVTSADKIIGSETALQELYRHYKDKLENAPDEVRREIFRTFINSIVVRGEELEIEVNLPPINTIAEQPFLRLSRNNTLSTLFLKARLLPAARTSRSHTCNG